MHPDAVPRDCLRWGHASYRRRFLFVAGLPRVSAGVLVRFRLPEVSGTTSLSISADSSSVQPPRRSNSRRFPRDNRLLRAVRFLRAARDDHRGHLSQPPQAATHDPTCGRTGCLDSFLATWRSSVLRTDEHPRKWVFGQHVFWAVSRGLGDSRARGARSIPRLKVLQDETGWQLAPGINLRSMPRATEDRIEMFVTLLTEAGAFGTDPPST